MSLVVKLKEEYKILGARLPEHIATTHSRNPPITRHFNPMTSRLRFKNGTCQLVGEVPRARFVLLLHNHPDLSNVVVGLALGMHSNAVRLWRNIRHHTVPLLSVEINQSLMSERHVYPNSSLSHGCGIVSVFHLSNLNGHQTWIDLGFTGRENAFSQSLSVLVAF
jgi:hypothetical protein